jgi:hypothetical protein
MGLNAQATRDINGLIATGNQAIDTLTWFSAIVLVLGGIGMASTALGVVPPNLRTNAP